MLKVGIIGAGLQGRRRVGPVIGDKESQLKWVVDRHLDRAQNLVPKGEYQNSTNYKDIVSDSEVNAVVVLTPPDSHYEISRAMLSAGKHVLCEKPMTRTSKDARDLAELAKSKGLVLKCGFNHRHHPAMMEMNKRVQAGDIGKPLFVRGKYGIGGRQDIKDEWRSNPEVVSGGQLMEQGIHLIDLISWMTGGIEEVSCMVSTQLFPIEPLEDNAFVLMRSKSGTLSSIHSTLCQWINEFELEIYGEKGFLCVEGLGASYGVEKLKFGLNTPGKPFNYETIEYRGGDISWEAEWKEFTNAIRQKTQPIGNGFDGANAVQVVESAYKANQTKSTVRCGF